MFWDTKDPPSHNIEILLESPDTKVELFLEEDNIIQECKTLKKNIVNYFTRPDVVRRMIELITTEPPEDISMSERFRHANVACEILTMGLPSLDEKLLADTDTLNFLYSYLENEPPLNPLLASFFSKTFSMLFTKKSDQDWFLYQQTCLKLLEYLKMKSNFLDLICKHFTTPIVPGLIMEMMQNVEGSQLKKNLYEWLVEERLVEKFIEIIGDPEQSEKHANVADFFCDLIHQGRIMRQDIDSFEPVFEGSDPILQKIESATTLLALFNVILQPNAVESAIVSGITVVLKIIRPTRMTDERNMDRLLNSLEREKEFHDEFLTTVIRVIEPQLKQFNELLKNPPKKPDIVTSAAKLSPPFGMARLQIVRLFSELLETKNNEISKAICETDFLDTLVLLFKEYCWNNFLHTEVEKCLHTIFPHIPTPPIDTTEVAADVTQEDSSKNGKNNSLEEMLNSALDINFFDKFDLLIKKPIPGNTPSAIQVHVIVNCKIMSKLIECWKYNKEIESAGKGRRLGYMGHLINIFKYITESISESEYLGALIESNLVDDQELELWQSIVNANDGELTQALSEQRKLLANHEPCEHNVSLDFFTDNNISDAFNGLCTLMDSSDADVIFTLDYNTQNDDHEFDDDDGDDDYNNINNDNNEGKDKDQRNDDAKNALNLFQFGRSNEDEEGDEDDNVAASFEGDGGLSFYVEPRVNPFEEVDDMMFEIFASMKADKSTESFADFGSICFANASTSNTNVASNAPIGTAAVTTSSSEEYDNNANVEMSSSWDVKFTPFEMPQKDTKFSANFIDDYEDDEGMWTKPFGASASTTTVEQSETQSVEPTNEADECKTNVLTNGPSTLEESEHGPKESALNQLNDSIEDNTLVDQTVEDITSLKENNEEVTKEINSELNIKQTDHEEETTSNHTSLILDNETENTTKLININTNTNQATSTATAEEEISDGSTATATATATTTVTT